MTAFSKPRQGPASILIVNRVASPDGRASADCVNDLAGALAQDGWRVTVMSSDYPARGDRSRIGAVTYVRAGPRLDPNGRPNPIGYSRCLFGLWRRAGSLAPHDVVLTLSDPPFLAALGWRLARRWNAAALHWSQDLYPDLFKINGGRALAALAPALRPLGRAVLRRQDRIIAVSRDMADQLTATGVPGKRIRYIPNWPLMDLQPLDPDAPSRLRRSLGWDDKFIILYAGNLGLCHPAQGWLAAAKELQDRAPHVGFLVVGDGRRRGEIEAAIARHSLANVRLLPKQARSALPDLMAAGHMHMCVVDSRAAGLMQPHKLNSAIACARPVLYLGPRTPGIEQAIELGGNGVIVPPEDAGAIADSIARFANDSTLWRRSCAAAAGMSGWVGRDTGLRRFLTLLEGSLPVSAARAHALADAEEAAPGTFVGAGDD